jgi:large subunit ribosomal protein L1
MLSSKIAASIARQTLPFPRLTTTARSSVQLLTSTTHRTYTSRAHPRAIPEVPLLDAMQDLLKLADQRRRRRERKARRNSSNNKLKSTTTEHTSSTTPEASPAAAAVSQPPTRHPDETVELAIHLNVDPRKPGQALRGSVHLPHGTGKVIHCVVFTNDPALQAQALAQGASHAGGDALIQDVVNGVVPVDSFQRALATSDVMPALTRQAARLLGPRGLMPNSKSNTLFPTSAELLNSLTTQLAGQEALYRTEKEGIVHVAVGKTSFGLDKLLENLGSVMKEVFAAKPEQYGKGKKSSSKATGKSAKYMLRASVSTTQGKGVRLDLRTIDPSSPFFLTNIDEGASVEKS